MSRNLSVARAFFALILLFLAGVATRSVAAQEMDFAGQDTVFTVQTSEPLVAWGNLGGVTVDRLGFIYVANFSDRVWRITPDGDVTTISTSLYGASGNAIDSRGRLLQSNFFAHTVSRIGRDGVTETLISDGLSGPVGIAVDPDDNFYVTNCNANSIGYVTTEGQVSTYSEGPLFGCPNSVVLMPSGELFVANFTNPNIIRIDTSGTPEIFASLPAPGNAHLAFARGSFYVTKIIANALYRVSMDGEVSSVLVSGATSGHADGPVSEASITRPNGIAVSPSGQELYINTLDGVWQGGKKSQILLRRVKLLTFTDLLTRAADSGGVEQLEAAYHAYKASPVGASDQTVGEAIRLGFQYLNQIKTGLAVRLFELNAESYPTVPAAHYNLGESYRYTGQSDKARVAYERTLELDPTHQGAQNRLAGLDQ